MSLSTSKLHMPLLPMRDAGNLRTKCMSHSGQYLARTRTSARALKGEKLIARSSQVRSTVAPKWPKVGFYPLQCRRTVGLASASGARCAVAETQTMERKSSSATIVSPPGKETLPMLDDGGSGFRGYGYTPYYRGDGSGGGSGGGGGGLPGSAGFPWGDYWLYIFLLLLRFLVMNIIGEGACVYKYEDGRNKPIRRYI